ncbi:OmpA family protein [Rhizobium lusitanum]|uniref:OmpA family protein n=1 Tax=Rhizobium lusitanum TaxID=293958 RepID=UPI001957FB77|nr:OmpA family protein [Rhizobium lusitanum]MBM7048486.1 OmpA family protein [Rhizobium lusitanum]
MSVRRICAVFFVGTLLAPVYAFSQEVTQQRIITGLANASKVAPKIDVELLRQQAAQNPSGSLAALPNWANLAKLSQMVVEINFVNNSVAMEPESYRTLGLIADALHHPNLSRYSFLIVGHTSSTGDAKNNLQLSEDRANAIKEALSTTFAVPPEHLYAVGAGQEYPIDGTNPTAAVNRRVQLFNLGVLK